MCRDVEKLLSITKKGEILEFGKVESGWERTLSINAAEVGNVDGSRIN